jgi:hypothetical protein
MSESKRNSAANVAELSRRALAMLLLGLGSTLLGQRAEAARPHDRGPDCYNPGTNPLPDKDREHDISFADTEANWKEWGNLVDGWVRNPSSQPRDVKELKMQMTGKITDFLVMGKDNRSIDMRPYNFKCQQPLRLPMPSLEMLENDVHTLKELLAASSGRGIPYPLPKFYEKMVADKTKWNLITNEAELINYGKQRLGEYLINECM